MKWLKKAVLFLTLTVVLGAAISGCATKRIPDPMQDQDFNRNRMDRFDTNVPGNNNTIDNNNPNNAPRVNQPDTNRTRDLTPGSDFSPGRLNTTNTSTDNIERAVQAIPGVKNASAVVTRDSAYVGISTDERRNTANTNTTDVENLKKQAANVVRKTDRSINNVYVSADANFVQRVDRIANDVRNGKPVEGFGEELRELVNRVTPQRK